MSLACVGSTGSVPTTLGFPRSWVCAFPIYTAQTPGYSIWSGSCVACGSSFQVFHKSADSVGPVFCAFPLEQLRQPGAWWAHSPWVRCTFSPSWSQPQFPRTGLVHEPCFCSQELVSSRSPPSVCQPSRISGSLWLETGSLKLGACLQFGRGCRLWGWICPFPLPPASCLWWWMGQSAAS